MFNDENSCDAEKGIQFVDCTIDWVRNFVVSSAFKDDFIFLSLKDACEDGLTLEEVLETNVFAESARDISKFTSLVVKCRD